MKNKEILELICMSFKNQGFSKRGPLIYKPISDNLEAIVYPLFIPDRKSGTTFVYINIAFRQNDIDKVYASLMNLKKSEMPAYTYVIGIEKIISNCRNLFWMFSVNNEAASTLDDMVKYVTTYAYPFWEELKNPNFLFDIIINDVKGGAYDKKTIIPIYLFIIGQKIKGIEYIENELRRMRKTKNNDEELFILQLSNLPIDDAHSNANIIDPQYLEFAERYKKL